MTTAVWREGEENQESKAAGRLGEGLIGVTGPHAAHEAVQNTQG